MEISQAQVPVNLVIDIIAAKTRQMVMMMKDGLNKNDNWNFKRPKPIMMRGAPGITKTESLRAMCRENNWGLLTRNVGNLLVEEFGGIPQFLEKDQELHTRWSIPEVIVELREMATKYEAVIFLLDDFHRASHEIQSTGFETFTDFSMKGHALPDNVVIVLAGNNSMKAGAKGFLSAIINRIAIWNVHLDREVWLQKMGEHLHQQVVAFFSNSANEAYLQAQEEDTANPWPSARSWTNLSADITCLEQMGMSLDQSDMLALYSAHVGVKAASAFQLFVELYNNTDLSGFFDHGRIDLPAMGDGEDAVKRYAYVAAVTLEVCNRVRKNKYSRVEDKGLFMELLQKLKDETPELMTCAMYLMKTLAAQNKVLHELSGAGILSDKFVSENLMFIREAND